jgi:hypothetical protein
MRPLELANRYVEVLFSGGDLEELIHLFAEDLKFSGPYYEFDSAADYVESLRSDPPAGFEYEMIRSFEDDSSACLVYRFSKPGVSTMMAQFFEIREGRIGRIVLIFDTGAFA